MKIEKVAVVINKLNGKKLDIELEINGKEFSSEETSAILEEKSNNEDIGEALPLLIGYSVVMDLSTSSIEEILENIM